MAKKEITVTFKTITPLWTGDAWQNNIEIRPSSLIGSLRFWFEVIGYVGGVLEKKDFNFQNGRFEKEVDRDKLKNFIQEKRSNINEIIKYLIEEQQIPISSVVFGTTNWKSLIEIKSIEPIEDYCFGNSLDLPYALGIRKYNDNLEKFENEDKWRSKINQYKGNNFKEKLKKARKDYSFFFFSQSYFYGKFIVKFLIEEEIIESIFFPLLTFMDKYGFWGGKWNIGYGRLKVKKVEKGNSKVSDFWEKSDFKLLSGICFNWINLTERIRINDDKDFEILKNILKVDKFYCKTERNFEEKIKNIPNKIILINLISNNNFKNIIRNILIKKFEIRNCLRPNPDSSVWKNFRHKLLGELGEGSKVLPFIYEENNHLQGGFLSIVGLLNLEDENND